MSLKLNVGVGYEKVIAVPIPPDVDVNVDVEKVYGVTVVADACHLPFVDKCFKNVYAFHLLEHLHRPHQGLKELLRVCCGVVEIEVPHWLGKWGGEITSFPRLPKDCGHVSHFKTRWFTETLKNIPHCIRVFWEFPRYISLHVWIYPTLRRGTVR